MAKKANLFNRVCDLTSMSTEHRGYFWSLIDVSEV